MNQLIQQELLRLGVCDESFKSYLEDRHNVTTLDEISDEKKSFLLEDLKNMKDFDDYFDAVVFEWNFKRDLPFDI